MGYKTGVNERTGDNYLPVLKWWPVKSIGHLTSCCGRAGFVYGLARRANPTLQSLFGLVV